MAAPADLDVEQAILDFEEARDKKKSNFKIFGRTYTDIPCFRQSFMTGIMCGLGVGLGFFLFTSRVRRACDVAVGSFGGTTLVNWFYCRYDRAQHTLELSRFKHEVAMETYTAGVTHPDLLAQPAAFDEDVSLVIAPKPRS